jgi:hypothetical protein
MRKKGIESEVEQVEEEETVVRWDVTSFVLVYRTMHKQTNKQNKKAC